MTAGEGVVKNNCSRTNSHGSGGRSKKKTRRAQVAFLAGEVHQPHDQGSSSGLAGVPNPGFGKSLGLQVLTSLGLRFRAQGFGFGCFRFREGR